MQRVFRWTLVLVTAFWAGCGGGGNPYGGSPTGETSGVNGCSTFEDHTAEASTAITPWDTSLGTKCVKIKLGHTVTWASSGAHPLEPKGGDASNPIPLTASPATVTFSTAGTFGFDCTVHHSSMQGAVQVLP